MNADSFDDMAEFSYELKIPKERVAILIGKEGCVKRQIETSTNTTLKIDSDEGDVFISGDDALTLYSAREVVKAVARGFSPENSLLLLKNDYVFEIINLPDLVKSKPAMMRLKGRVIGHEGKSRRIIEEMTDCVISVYGKTIGIIGRVENVDVARTAVDMLLEGSPHANVYKWLEKKRKDSRMFNMNQESMADIVKEEFQKEL
jgi:ribosomal RNA assembly protein